LTVVLSPISFPVATWRSHSPEDGTRKTLCVEMQAEFYFENGMLEAGHGDNTLFLFTLFHKNRTEAKLFLTYAVRFTHFRLLYSNPPISYVARNWFM